MFTSALCTLLEHDGIWCMTQWPWPTTWPLLQLLTGGIELNTTTSAWTQTLACCLVLTMGLFCPSTALYGPVLLYTKLHTGTVRSVGVLVPPRYLRCRQLCHQRRRPLLQDCSAGQKLLMHHHQYLQLWYNHMVCRVSSHQLGSRCTSPR